VIAEPGWPVVTGSVAALGPLARRVELRNLAGMTGIGLLSAATLGGAFGWTGPMAYWLLAETALAAGWNRLTSPGRCLPMGTPTPAAPKETM
jgi:hypothetical protein